MASSKGYLEFILDQLSGLDGVTWRAMMGEYILYYQGKIIGGIYDDRFLVKPAKVARALMPHADLESPYEGAKEMLLVDNVENGEFLKKLVEAVAEELPASKKRAGLKVDRSGAGNGNHDKESAPGPAGVTAPGGGRRSGGECHVE